MYRSLILLPNELVRTNKLYMYIYMSYKNNQKNFTLIFQEMKKKKIFKDFNVIVKSYLGYRLIL